MSSEWISIIALFGTFGVLLVVGMPITFAIGLASLVTIGLAIGVDQAVFVIAQKMAGGLDTFSLLAIPFFILAGNIMNRGGLALRLVNFAKIIVGWIPGALAHCNVLANMLFGALSGSAVAAGAAVGGMMAPLQEKEGYDPAYSASVNICSCPTGLLIPPSNAFIVYSLISGGTSIAALFVAGYIPGILMGLGVMVVAYVMAKKEGYKVIGFPGLKEALLTTWAALPSLGLIIIIMGGIILGVCTATEAASLAVVYTLVLTLVIYREMKVSDLPRVLLESAVTTAIVLILIGVSSAMAWAMTNADIPYTVSDTLLGLSENKFVLLLFINILLLVVGTFMDMTPALLVFTPIFLPVTQQLGVDPVHFGVMIVFNLCIGICTPPVGSALFVGCSVAGVSIDRVLGRIFPFFAVMILTLMMVTFIPDLSLALPKLALGYVPVN
ncbi:MAG: TRAP transporter large permease [Methylobacteriaceae bacterium]|jgi:tripartite ATP-independent transporter DctM subunit|nr:TRAP transporter large permease [Methylobacteriaceae bacterium]